MTVHGLLLAAGAGRRMGTPKALVDDWLVRGVTALRDGGCDEVTVVLGASIEEARALLAGDRAHVVEAHDWAKGMGASLRAGLASLTSLAGLASLAELPDAPDGPDGPDQPDAALVSLVDLPDVGADVVRRVLGSDAADGAGRMAAAPDVLRRASYDGVPGHPVLIGRDHWAGVRTSAEGDRGARAYLATHDVELVECADLATGRDMDSR